LPPDVLGELSRLVLAHKEVFATRLPAVVANLMPHIKAGMVEAACGILDIKELEDAVMGVLAANGVKPQLGRSVRCESEIVNDGQDYRCEWPNGHNGPHQSGSLHGGVNWSDGLVRKPV
jgi:hypothetical protein